jgi:hypothetical protein
VVKHCWNSWENGEPSLESTRLLLSHYQKTLFEWSSSKYGDVSRKIKLLTNRLERLQRREHAGLSRQIELIQIEINGLMEMEDIKWKQRAEKNWYQNGNKNTKFFHAWATQRRQHNHIEKILDSAGFLCAQPEDINQAFVQHFKQVFCLVESWGLQDCLAEVQSRVTQSMNVGLMRCFTPDEVDAALGQMSSMKAPGPDGFGVCFFTHNWETIGDAVRGAVLNFLNQGNFDPGINTTFIALVPKVSHASLVHNFLPISLCNVVYKLISKVLANRLKLVLPSIISKQQSAFVPRRLISDNILVAYKALHTMATRMKGKKGYMAIKVDISKAYDRVEWSFSRRYDTQARFCRKMDLFGDEVCNYGLLFHFGE